MAVCRECGVDPDRAQPAPWVERHRRTSDALDELHLRPGAQHLSVDVTPARRVAMNRIARATGLSLREQICRALDQWLPAHRIDLSTPHQESDCGEPAGVR